MEARPSTTTTILGSRQWSVYGCEFKRVQLRVTQFTCSCLFKPTSSWCLASCYLFVKYASLELVWLEAILSLPDGVWVSTRGRICNRRANSSKFLIVVQLFRQQGHTKDSKSAKSQLSLYYTFCSGQLLTLNAPYARTTSAIASESYCLRLTIILHVGKWRYSLFDGWEPPIDTRMIKG